MRRWNGWGDASVTYPISDQVLNWLGERLGKLSSPQDVSLETQVHRVAPSRLPGHPLIHTAAEDRVRHARGQSLPDWIAVRSGRIARFPEGVAYPESDDDLRDLFGYARQVGAALIPYGGGTSVVGGVNPEEDGPPAITVDLSRMSGLLHLDTRSRLATFGAGIRGPHLEAALRAQGHMLGHFPQSFELSTLGGWIATRSSGQQALYYGRIERLLAGGRLVTPAGTLDLPPFPASAAGPDLREWVLGSEGRMGIISRATVRITPTPAHEEFHAVFFPSWAAGVEAAREIVQAGLTLSMLRLSDPSETEANLVLAGHEQLVNLLHGGLTLMGHRRGEKCLLLLGATGGRASVRRARRDAIHIARRYGGLNLGQMMGQAWARTRFKTPYLRNTLWESGVAVDTLETAVPWSDVHVTAEAILQAIRNVAAVMDEPVLAFAHLSHLYPTGASIYVTFLFRVESDPDHLLERWQGMKQAASRVIVEHGGTITHQHAVGTDHAPYLEAEKGKPGMALIAGAIRQCDPDGIMNPGKLVQM